MLGYLYGKMGNYPEESIQHSAHSKSLKSRIPKLISRASRGYRSLNAWRINVAILFQDAASVIAARNITPPGTV